jgi:hypothetical protein
MKKLVILILILVVLGATAFYFGWIQIRLPENTYAVIFTKTGGWDEAVVNPGKFVWRWERLIPTNLKMHTFALKPYTANVTASGSLPSGDIYAGILDPAPDFGFTVALSVSFGIEPESLPHLVSTTVLSEDTFDAWHNEVKTAIAAKATAFIRDRSTEVNAASSLTSMGDSIITDLIKDLESSFSDVDFKGIVVQNIEMPDIELYQTAKQLFLEFSRSRKESFENVLSQITWTESRADQHFSVLERYGDLITRFPALLDLLTLKGGDLSTILDEIDAYSGGDEKP